jgi:hypothetical protein
MNKRERRKKKEDKADAPQFSIIASVGAMEML